MTAFGLALVLLVQHAACDVQPPASGDISCGNGERRALCSLCPNIYRDGEFVSQELNICRGDCRLVLVVNDYVCVFQVPSAPETPQPVAPADPPDDAPPASPFSPVTPVSPASPFSPVSPDSPASPAPTPASHPEHSPPLASLLSMVELNIVNSGRSRPNKVSFKVEVCIGQACCETGVMSKRSGLLKFGSVFGNLGDCTQLRKGPNDPVFVKAMIESTATPLKVRRITAQFADGSLFAAENSREVWEEGSWMRAGGWRRHMSPVPWNRLWRTTRSNVVSEATYSNPPPQCPEYTANLTNTCPKAHVRVLRRLPDKRKLCYYQECATFATDLSTVEIGHAGLGSGGYCRNRRDFFPQYQYCCDLEQYFTHDDEQATDRPQEEINFPRCPTMIEPTP